MNIVIIGAGEIGLHVAKIFSEIDYGIVLIDSNPRKIEKAARELDISARVGSASDWELLEELMELAPDLLIALTDDDESNLVACSIAKNLGYPQTIARLRNPKYFLYSRLNFERLFCVDHVIGPEKLTADAISNMILIPGEVIATESFAHGSVQMRTVEMPERWRKGEIPLMDRSDLELPKEVMVGLIRRSLEGSKQSSLIFPHGTDTLRPGDEVTYIGATESIRNLHKFLGASSQIPRSVVIVGGSLIGINLVHILQEYSIRVQIIERDFEKCRLLSEILPSATVIHRDGTDYAFLEAERMGEAEVFVACTKSDETNFLAGTIARDLGCKNVIISLSDTNYMPLLSRLGIDQAASPRLRASNRILSIARERTVASMVSMYGHQAEIMEVKVSIDAKIAGIPIHQLGPELPRDFLIVVIQSKGRVFIADGSRVLSPGDTVIVISSPTHTHELRKLF